MNRLGCAILALILIVTAGFLLTSRWDRQPPSPSGTPPPRLGTAMPLVPANSGLVVPVAGVARSRLADTFGDSRSDGNRIHGALDIPAPNGTPVVAATGGRVEKLFESERGGHTVYIRSPDDRTVYYYAHLEGYAPGLKEGDEVKPGQTIGSVGSSGDADASAPHLHFEIKVMAPGDRWWQGRGINPYPLLAGRGVTR